MLSWVALTFLLAADAPRLRLGVALEETRDGLVITRVAPHSAADRAGLRVGQCVEGLETHRLSTTAELIAALEAYAHEPAVTVHLRPPPTTRRLIVPSDGVLGIQVRASTYGLAVDRVARGSAAERAWLAVGDRITAVAGVAASSTTAWATRTATLGAGSVLELEVRGAAFSVRVLNDAAIVRAPPAAPSTAPHAPSSRPRPAPRRTLVTQLGVLALVDVADGGRGVAVGGSVGVVARALMGSMPSSEGGGMAALDAGLGAFAGVIAAGNGAAALTGVQLDLAILVGGFQAATGPDQPGVAARVGMTARLGRVSAGGKGAFAAEFDLTAGLEIARFVDDDTLHSVLLYAGLPLPFQGAVGFGGVRFLF